MLRNPKRKSLKKTKTVLVEKERRVEKSVAPVTLLIPLFKKLETLEASHHRKFKQRRAKRWNLSSKNRSELNLFR
jgi:hypothetical protein